MYIYVDVSLLYAYFQCYYKLKLLCAFMNSTVHELYEHDS